jgi:hypothetical protein
VIHELLIGTNPKVRPVLTWNMLIGGPNQSHKVNFKEPVPVKGKISKRTFAFCSVNTFPEFFRKKFCEGTLFSQAPCSSHLLLSSTTSEGRAEHGNCSFVIKIFLDIKTNASILCLLSCLCVDLSPPFLPPVRATTNANIALCRGSGFVSINIIQTLLGCPRRRHPGSEFTLLPASPL